MALTLQQIIDEADVLVSNAYSIVDKTTWLNAINQDFFEVVKIPNLVPFSSIANQSSYTLTGNIKTKNIDKVQVGTMQYKSILYDDVKPSDNYFTFNETSLSLILNPAPSQIRSGILRYFSCASSNFVSTTLTVNPDAPSEYHWIYVLGLCEKIAGAMDDTNKANNYGQDYRNALNVAAQNYQRGG